jgi:hypothetical protein
VTASERSTWRVRTGAGATGVDSGGTMGGNGGGDARGWRSPRATAHRAAGVAALLAVFFSTAGIAAVPAAATPLPAPDLPAAVRLVAAGDIGCGADAVPADDRCQAGAVASLVAGLQPTFVLPLGDLAPADGDYTAAYAPTWGSLAPISLPVVGDQDHGSEGAEGYHTYWREAGADPDGDGVPGVRDWYQRYVGAGWRVLALDTNCDQPRACELGGPQHTFLQRVLAGLPDNPCVVVATHRPRFSTGIGGEWFAPLFDLIAAKRIPLVLSGHDDRYERTIPAGPSGWLAAPAPGATTLISIGTGGASVGPGGSLQGWHARVVDRTFGALSLDLVHGRAEASFVDVAGAERDRFSAACTPVPAPSVALKTPIHGFIDRQGKISDDWAGIIRGLVVHVPWSVLQPVEGEPIPLGNPVDEAIQAAVDFNDRHPEAPIALKLRVQAGIFAPDWLKERTGTAFVRNVSGVLQHSGDTYLWWKPEARQAYDALMAELAGRYDGEGLIREVQISRCTTIFEEPFLRQRRDPESFANLLAAGLTAELDLQCHHEQIEAHNVWTHTRSALAVNPYQHPDHNQPDVAFAVDMMHYCRAVLGARCLLENHSMKEAERGSDYDELYTAMAAFGRPLVIQTETPHKVGDLSVVVDDALALGAEAIELPRSYRDGDPQQFRRDFAHAIAQMAAIDGIEPPPFEPPAFGPPPVPSEPPPDVSLEEADSAVGYLLGSIWSDGFAVEGGIAAFSTRSPEIADSIEAAARAAGWRAERRNGARAKYQIRFPDLPFDSVNYHGPMPRLAQESDRRLVAFLVGVIQSEGGKGTGLVLDDPYEDRAQAMSVMLDRLGLAHRVEGQQFFRVFVEQSDWPVFATWPFVSWARVPGGPS